MRQKYTGKDSWLLYSKALVWLVMLLACLPAYPQLTDAVKQYAQNQAAIVMVRMEIQAEVNVQKININYKSFNRLLDSIQRLEKDSIFLSSSEKLDIVLREFQERPQHYFVSEFSYFRHREKVLARGSGFIVSGNGYVLTNCHVIDEGDAMVSRRFILSAFNYVTETNINSIEQAWVVKFTEQQRSQLYKTFANVYSRIVPIELEKISKKVVVIMNTDNAEGRKVSREIPAVIVKKGKPMPGKDIAVLKIETGFELPAIPLSASNDVLVGEEILVYGYPNSVAKNEYLSDETVSESTLTRGIISAKKKTINGWPVLQMDADINRGNSGGPVCNKNGEVIGISTFGTLDDNARALAPGLNFAIPLEVIQEFITDSIQLGRTEVSKLFGEGVMLYQKGFYRKALHNFKLVSKRNPFYPDLQLYMKKSEAGIIKGEDREPNDLMYYFLLLLFGGLIAGLLYYKLR